MQNKCYVYMIHRDDGQLYIGTTVSLAKRMKAHSKTKRFSEHKISRYEVLGEFEEYEDALKYEEKMISLHDTFVNGLNSSVNGRGNHLCDSFSTKGYVFSEESRKKMSDSAKKRAKRDGYAVKELGHTKPDVRKAWSKKRKGVYWGKSKLSISDMDAILTAYENEDVSFTDEFIRCVVAKKYRDAVGKIPYENMTTPNGVQLSYKVLICKHFADLYGVTYTRIASLLRDGRSNVVHKIYQ